MSKAKIIYHKNCMDGLASAFITQAALVHNNFQFFHFSEIIATPVQYGEEHIIFEDETLSEDDVFYFVDFSLKKEQMIELSKKVNIINILDHHKTAKGELDGLEDELDNITIIFDMDKSGAMICYDYFKRLLPESFADDSIFRYIEDRDLWKWKMPFSKEINAALRFYIEPNNLESFEDVYSGFNADSFIKTGEILLLNQEQQVKSKIKKVKEVSISGITFKAVNATENISELGNAICAEYDMPALVYFITEKDEAVCSLRSIDSLPDVSVVAKALGGGGHRNACGFTTNLDHLGDILLGA